MGNRVGLQYRREGRLSAAQGAAAENPAPRGVRVKADLTRLSALTGHPESAVPGQARRSSTPPERTQQMTGRHRVSAAAYSGLRLRRNLPYVFLSSSSHSTRAR